MRRGLMALKGYAGRVLRIDLSKGRIWEEPIEEDAAIRFIGGRGFVAKILCEEVPAGVDPLGPENELIFMAGPFAGTPIPNSGRHQVGCKSPLTGILAHSDCGGTWGQELKRSGYDGIIISGRSERPVYLWIEDGGAELRDSDHWGLDAYEATDAILKETDQGAKVACIGPAGEKLVKFASILHDGRHARMAARAGVGAVMGSKRLKAIAVRGSGEVEVHDPEGLQRSIREAAQDIVRGCEGLSKNGTANIIQSCELAGDLPIKNWQLGRWEEGAERISGGTMSRTILTGRFYCARCIVGCGRVVRVEDQRFGAVEGGGPEYESLGALGSLCLVDDLNAIAKANELCNRYGMDTISTGSAIAFAIEAFERGLITKEDTGGVALEWGDWRTLIEMVRMIGERRGVGELLGEGVRAAARRLGRGSEEFSMHVKGLECPMHDPRAYASLALGYATSNRGACHMEAFSHVIERGLAIPDLGYPARLDPSSFQGKGEMVAKMQNLMALFDSLPACKFLVFGKVGPARLSEWFGYVTGRVVSKEELLLAGERIFNLERLYNVRCGISRKGDWLPLRILADKRADRWESTSLPHLGEMLSDYYRFRGWTIEGIPTEEKVKELGLEGFVRNPGATWGSPKADKAD
jgi:aldehyde:ferredoxin oxidoreductase